MPKLFVFNHQIKSDSYAFKQKVCRTVLVKNLKVVQAVLPNGLEDLPEPDRIFIGGGGRDLVKIIDTASEYLKPDGVIVINTVILSNVEAALKTLKSKGFKTAIVLVQIHRGQDMPWGERLNALNPVWIISAIFHLPGILRSWEYD